MGWVCSRTLTVSKGWPTMVTAIPPVGERRRRAGSLKPAPEASVSAHSTQEQARLLQQYAPMVPENTSFPNCFRPPLAVGAATTCGRGTAGSRVAACMAFWQCSQARVRGERGGRQRAQAGVVGHWSVVVYIETGDRGLQRHYHAIKGLQSDYIRSNNTLWPMQGAYSAVKKGAGVLPQPAGGPAWRRAKTSLTFPPRLLPEYFTISLSSYATYSCEGCPAQCFWLESNVFGAQDGHASSRHSPRGNS